MKYITLKNERCKTKFVFLKKNDKFQDKQTNKNKGKKKTYHPK